MENFAILRVQKLKHINSVTRSLNHSFREIETPNADPEKFQDNAYFYASSTTEALSNLRSRLPSKYRKDAVLAIEYLITASAEALNGMTKEVQDSYFDDAIAWLKQRHGEDNVIAAGVHRDELTPHLYAYVVPIDESSGRLNCKKWLGAKDALSTMQTDFARTVANKFGLERGITGSKAKHQKVKRFYEQMNSAATMPEIDAEDFKPRLVKEKQGLLGKDLYETPEAVSLRLKAKFEDAVETLAAKAAIADEANRRMDQYQRTAKYLSEKLDQVNELCHPLLEIQKLCSDTYERVRKELYKVKEKLEAEAEQKKASIVEQRRKDDFEKSKRADFESRIASIVAMKGKVGGMKATIVYQTIDAMKLANGDCFSIDWVQVMRDSIKESLIENHQEKNDVIKCLKELAPVSEDDLHDLIRLVNNFDVGHRKDNDQSNDYMF